MKLVVVLFASLSMVALTGCELLQILALAEGGGCPGAEESQGTMTADIDGEAFDSCITVGSGDGGALTVTGQEYKDGLVPYQLQISITNAAVGSFALGTAEGGQGRYTEGVDTTYATVLDVATGTVDVATFDDAGAAGTFSFSAVDASNGDATIEITGGAFDVTFE
jgi:hypothetical protein